MPLTACIAMLQCKPGEAFLKGLFEPLGYRVHTVAHELDSSFPEWGQSPYFTVTLSAMLTVKDLFNHLYVLIPVLDNQKHYFIDENEIQKLLERGEGWLSSHPLRHAITKRYLKYLKSYEQQATCLLEEDDEEGASGKLPHEGDAEPSGNLNRERLGAVMEVLRASEAQTVVDLGCGTGKLPALLLKEKQVKKIVGFDVSVKFLELARERLHLDTLPEMRKNRIELIHGSLLYRDKRLEGFDAAVVMEVIEHLPPERLKTFEQVAFECARPGLVIVTTPNREYNVVWQSTASGALRHRDHRFEWTRTEFETWAKGVARRYSYAPTFQSVGEPHEHLGAPTQMCILKRKDTQTP